MKPVYIGTSGWSYKDWAKSFYPEDVTAGHQFEYYATRFPTVEINSTFYRLPTTKAVKVWHDEAPPGFLFAVKGSRFITHMKKLADLDGALEKIFDQLRPMKPQIGIILWQLPGFLKKGFRRLEGFLKQLPDTYNYAVEFRDPSWEVDEIFKLLKKHDVAHVNLSSLNMPRNFTVTSDHIYIRFHGLSGGAAHNYTHRELKPWADFIEEHPHQTVFAYFNNDVNTRAPENARMLMEMVGKRAEEAKSEACATMALK